MRWRRGFGNDWCTWRESSRKTPWSLLLVSALLKGLFETCEDVRSTRPGSVVAEGNRSLARLQCDAPNSVRIHYQYTEAHLEGKVGIRKDKNAWRCVTTASKCGSECA
jgi:hypothetical protein